MTSVSIDSAKKITVAGSTVARKSTLVVTATIQYGQIVTKNITPYVESKPTASLNDDTLSVTAGTLKDSSAYTMTGGTVEGKAALNVTASSGNVGVTCPVYDGKIATFSD